MPPILVTAIYRDRWFTQALMPDCCTVAASFQYFASFETMLKALRYVGATEAEIAELLDELRGKSHGSLWMTPAPGRKNLLGLRPVYFSFIVPAESPVSTSKAILL